MKTIKKTLKITLIVLVTSLVTGCFSLPSILQVPSDDNAKATGIELWVSSKQFGRAIKAAEDNVKAAPSKSNNAKLAEVRVAAALYEKNTINKAQQKIRRGKWQGAFVVVNEALEHYPSSNKLRLYSKKLAQKQSTKIRKLRYSLLASNAANLLRNKPIYQAYAKLDPQDADVAWKLKKVRIDIIEMAKSATIAGKQSIQDKDYGYAQKYLELADQLNPSAENTKALADLAQSRIIRIQRNLRKIAKAKALKLKIPLSKEQKAQHQKLRRLIITLRTALRRSDYDRANKLLLQANGISTDHPEIEKLRLALYNSIHAKVSQLVRNGNDLYSKGRIEQARVSWKRALKLDPKNSHIQSSVERANRVLAKLREIKKQQPRKSTN